MLKLRLLFVIVAMFVGTTIVSEAQSADPKEFVQGIGDSVSALIAGDSNLTPQQREAGFRKILKENFNLPAICKFVLAKYIKNGTDEEIEEFVRLFEEIIVETFSDQFKDYSGAKLKVTGSKPGSKGAIIVSSEVLGPKPLHVDWYVREENGQLLVYDITVENVSIRATKRSEYASTLCAGGEKAVKALNAALKEKINKGKN